MSKKINKINELAAAILGCACVLGLGAPKVMAGPYEDERVAIGVLGGVHFGNYFASQAFGVGFISANIEYGTNLGLKRLPAYVEAPDTVVKLPNDGSCHFRFNHERYLEEQRNNYLDLIQNWASPYDTDYAPNRSWGVLGEPLVDHYHSDTLVSVSFKGEPIGRNPDLNGLDDVQVIVPTGLNLFTWRADTTATPLVDYVPWHLISAAANVASDKISKTAKNRKAKEKALEAIETIADNAPGALNIALDPEKQAGVFTEVKQSFVVIDENPPEIHHDLTTGLNPGNPYIVRAVDPGGSKFDSFSEELMTNFTATDDCAFGEPVELAPRLTPQTNPNGAPGSFFVTGDVREIKIVATDHGPKLRVPGVLSSWADEGNETELSVWVKVEDHEPPLLIPPHNLVVEATPEMLSQGYASRATGDTPENDPFFVEIGNPSVFDLGDRYPEVDDDGITQFPVNARTTITWRATDVATNFTTAPQVITIKDPLVNPNTAPTAHPKNDSTKVSEPVEITLTGLDRDAVSGVNDPLNFEITKSPENGFLLAPPNPYFIEDYRRTWKEESTPCGQETPETIKFPEQISVADNGHTFILGGAPGCHGGKQISIFDKEGNYLDSTWADQNVNSFEVLDGVAGAFSVPLGVPVDAREPGIYFIVESRFEFPTIGHQPMESDGTVADDRFGRNRWNFSNLGIKGPRIMTVDERGYVWTMGSSFDIYQLAGGGELIQITPGVQPNIGVGMRLLNGKPASHLATDSDDNLYVSQPDKGRVYKFSPANSGAQPIEMIGWMGRCDSGVNCDVDNRRSHGFSCTDETCGVEGYGLDADAFRASRDAELEACGLPTNDSEVRLLPGEGCQPGQFNFPTKISLDPNNNLYVADYFNRRVQRFTSTGEFTGEAKSKCDGSCFVLGDFGRPFKMTVNSFGFYVLDEYKKLLHVFEASPFSDITPNSAVVEYQSNFDILGVNEFSITDSFEYSVNDGLAHSVPATVQVTVNRNHRAPTALTAVLVETIDGETGLPIQIEVPQLLALEDLPQRFNLQGTDPDFQDVDGLTFQITTPPANGVLSISGGDYVYTPNLNFVGSDEFAFVASDAATSNPALVSEPAVVQIQVTPVPDAPELDMPDPKEAGIGFPVHLMVDVSDPDSNAKNMRVVTDWGDGCIDVLDDAIDNGMRFGCSIANADGVGGDNGSLSLTLAANNPGLLSAEHIYRTSGAKTVTVCLQDKEIGAQPLIYACSDPRVDVVATTHITVSPKADVVSIIEDDMPRDEDGQIIEGREAGLPVNITVTIRNRTPSTDSNGGHTNVGPSVASIAVDERLDYYTVPAGCTTGAAPSKRLCAISGLVPGEETQLNFRVSAHADVLEDIQQSITVSLDAQEDEVDGGYYWATLLPFKMNPVLDTDNDGVANGEDAFPGDPDEQFDTDTDGIGNNADLDDDGDTMPDSWENQNGLDSLNANDADADADNDGLSNLEEYQAGANPNDSDSDKDRLVDGVDNCPADFNANQFDEDVDTVGNACDQDYLKAVAVLPDLNGNQRPSIAGMRVDNARNIEVQVSDAETGEQLRILSFLSDAWNAKQVLSITEGMASPSIAVRAERMDTGLPIVQIKNAATGDLQTNLYPWNAKWKLVDMDLVPAQGAMGGPVIATLARRRLDGVIGIELRDPMDGTRIRLIYPLGPTWTAHQLEVVPNINGAPAIAVLATRNSDQLTIVQVRSAETGDLIRNVYPLGLNFTPHELRVIPDVDGDGVWDTAVRMTRDNDGLELIQIRNTVTQALIRSIYPIGAGGRGWSTQQFKAVNINGFRQLAILSTRDADQAMLVQIKDPFTGVLVKNTWFIGAPWRHQQGFEVMGDFNGTGVDELAVLSNNAATGARLIQIRDAISAEVIRNVHQPN